MSSIKELILQSNLPENTFYKIFGGKERVLFFVRSAGKNQVHYHKQCSIKTDLIRPDRLSFNDGGEHILYAKLQNVDELADCAGINLYVHSSTVVADITSIGKKRFDALDNDACIGYNFFRYFYYPITKYDVDILVNGNERINL